MESRLRAAIERSGGSGVWVKGAGAARGHRVGAPLEVLAVSSAFDPSLAAIKSQARQENLEPRVKETRDRGRVADVRLLRGNDQVARLRLREVEQLRRAAIVIDDLGGDLSAAHRLLEIPYPLTFSVLPHLRHSAEVAEQAHAAGREVMLHLPMEPEPGSHAAPGEGEVRAGMAGVEAERIVRDDLDSLPFVAGVNNHMGSRATTEPRLMAAVMKVLAERHVYFIDSRTTPASIALAAARRAGVPASYRSVFLDDVETIPYTLGQLRKFRRAVEEQGAALAIGHPHPSTLAALATFLPELEKQDIQLVTPSELVRLPETARPSPHRAATP